MIPRHRPPFGVGSVLATFLTSSKKSSVEQVEAAYAAVCGLPHAVLLPSARAGICWALRAAVDQETTVIGPAYTCQVVHEAMVRSAGQVRLIDTDAKSFLMDPVRLAAEQSGNCAIVFCEIYGYPYHPRVALNHVHATPRLRIIDAAMTVPVPEIFARLQRNDFAVLSFGLGKCIYAGWGGMGLTHDDALANEVRKQRDARLQNGDLMLSLRRWSAVLLRTLAHARVLYGPARRLSNITSGHMKTTLPPTREPCVFSPGWYDNENLAQEWRLPSTALDRRLIVRNLTYSDRLSEQRLALARRYQENLSGVASIALPPPSPYALSHYTIRVSPTYRQTMRTALWRSGVDTGTYFGFPSYLSQHEFPYASRLSREVLNLPLDASLTQEDVDYISDCVIRCVSQGNWHNTDVQGDIQHAHDCHHGHIHSRTD